MTRVFSNNTKDFRTVYSSYLKEKNFDSSTNDIHIKLSKGFKNIFHEKKLIKEHLLGKDILKLKIM